MSLNHPLGVLLLLQFLDIFTPCFALDLKQTDYYIIGGAIGGGVIILLLLICCCCRKKSRKQPANSKINVVSSVVVENIEPKRPAVKVIPNSVVGETIAPTNQEQNFIEHKLEPKIFNEHKPEPKIFDEHNPEPKTFIGHNQDPILFTERKHQPQHEPKVYNEPKPEPQIVHYLPVVEPKNTEDFIESRSVQENLPAEISHGEYHDQNHYPVSTAAAKNVENDVSIATTDSVGDSEEFDKISEAQILSHTPKNTKQPISSQDLYSPQHDPLVRNRFQRKDTPMSTAGSSVNTAVPIVNKSGEQRHHVNMNTSEEEYDPPNNYALRTPKKPKRTPSAADENEEYRKRLAGILAIQASAVHDQRHAHTQAYLSDHPQHEVLHSSPTGRQPGVVPRVKLERQMHLSSGSDDFHETIRDYDDVLSGYSQEKFNTDEE